MKRLRAVLPLALGASLLSSAASPQVAPKSAAPSAKAPSEQAAEAMGYIPFDDPRLVALLAKINAVGPYEVPDLGVKRDTNYSQTPEDIEAFGHQKPFNEFFLEQILYTGPGRAIPEPDSLSSVKIGFIGPIRPTVSVATGGKSHEEALGVPMLQGARLAIDEWNARGGYKKRGIPFELVVKNDNGLWGSSGNEIVDMAYKDGVWALLGTIDGANSHIAIRVALKAEVLVMNSGDTDPTFLETNIPWVARVIGDDRQQSYILIDYLYRKLGLKRIGILRASNRYGRFGVRQIRDGSRRLGHPIAVEMAYKPGSTDFSMELERIREAKVDGVIHWGDATECALILNQMRSMGMTQPYFGCDRCVSDEFLKVAGENAKGAVFAFPWNPDRVDPKLDRFRKEYRERFGSEANTYSAHGYDGMNVLVWAIQAAGLNRAKIRDVVAYLPAAWPGVTGDIALNASLGNVSETYLASLEKGRWRYQSRKDLGIPRGFIPPRDRLSRDAPAPPPAP